MNHLHTCLALCCLLSVACGGDTRPPGLPSDAGGGSGGGVGPTIGGGHSGSGGSGGSGAVGGRDASVDGGITVPVPFAIGECIDDGDLNTLTTSVLSPSDFVVTRAFAHWVGACSNPILEIGLSTGSCPDGAGHQLTIQIVGDSIGTALMIPGGNQLTVDEPDAPIRVRYTRPESIEVTPFGTWGTCPGVTGELVIEDLGIVAGDLLRADFFFTLAPCGLVCATCDDGNVQVSGSFSLTLVRGIVDVCGSAP